MTGPNLLASCALGLLMTVADPPPQTPSLPFTPDHLSSLRALYRTPALAHSNAVRADCVDLQTGERTSAIKAFERSLKGKTLSTRTLTALTAPADGHSESRTRLTFTGENSGTVVFEVDGTASRPLAVHVAGDALVTDGRTEEGIPFRSKARFAFAADHYWISEETVEDGDAEPASASVCRMELIDRPPAVEPKFRRTGAEPRVTLEHE